MLPTVADEAQNFLVQKICQNPTPAPPISSSVQFGRAPIGAKCRNLRRKSGGAGVIPPKTSTLRPLAAQGYFERKDEMSKVIPSLSATGS